MPLYFLMGTTTENGQRLLREDPDLIIDAVREIQSDDAKILGQYAVLGRYDFVMLAEAIDNDTVARLSLEMSVRVGLHIETLPAIAIRLSTDNDEGLQGLGNTSAETPAGEWNLPQDEPS